MKDREGKRREAKGSEEERREEEAMERRARDERVKPSVCRSALYMRSRKQARSATALPTRIADGSCVISNHHNVPYKIIALTTAHVHPSSALSCSARTSKH